MGASIVIEFVSTVSNGWVANSVVVVEYCHNVVGEIRHVFGHEEGKVTKLVFLLENNLIFKLRSGPDCVFWYSDQVSRTRENTDWELDVAHFILRSVAKTVSVDVGLDSTIVESLELLLGKRNGLPIVEPVSISGTGWSIVDHVQESILVIDGWIRVNEHAGENIAEFTVVQAAKFDSGLCCCIAKWNKVVLTSQLKNELQDSKSVISEETHTFALDTVEGGYWSQEDGVVNH